MKSVPLLSPEECRLVILRCERLLSPATLRGGKVREELRKASTCYPRLLGDVEVNAVLEKVRKEASLQCGLPEKNQEHIQYCLYGEGGHFVWHRDEGRRRDEERLGFRESGGRREWSFIVYLNQGYGGGETEFRSGEVFKGLAGSILGWRNQGRMTEHRARPVTSGSKSVLLLWVRSGAHLPEKDLRESQAGS